MSDHYDFVVIGGGSAGYAAASTAARLGLQTAVIEGGREVGGLCILRGCMPSKALLESGHRGENIRRAAEFGLRAQFLGADPEAILARKRMLVADFAEYRKGQLANGDFTFIRATARFLDPHTLALTLPDGGRRQIRSRTILIATGSRMNRIDLPGLEATGCWDSDEVLEATEIPKSVIVLGGGAIGLEFASYYAGVGSKVTLLQRGPQLLSEMDGDIATAVARGFINRGIELRCGTAIIGLERAGDGKRVLFFQDGEKKSVEAPEIIYALGRKPLVEGLDIENAGIALRGPAILTSARQQTSCEHIFAAGDVCGPHEVVHIAIQQGEIAARNAASLLQKPGAVLESIDYRLKLFAVFSQPEVAAIGLTEREAAAAGLDCMVATYLFSDHGKAMIRGETDGFVKLVVARDTREILGAAVVGPEASELIHEISVAMYFHATAGDLSRVPHYHPTLSEIWTYPAEELA